MSDALVQLQPALILQHRPYRETSLLLEAFTRDYGIVSILARGVRKEKSKTAGLLLPFAALRLSYWDKHELKTLQQVEWLASYSLQRRALYCGFYVNELMQRFLHKHDPHPELFARYRRCLEDLSQSEAIEQTLRYFELDLLAATGYGAELDVEASGGGSVQDVQRYRFLAGSGMLADDEGPVSGATLLCLAKRAPLDDAALLEAKRLLRAMLDEHLHGKPLKSREVLSKIVKYL